MNVTNAQLSPILSNSNSHPETSQAQSLSDEYSPTTQRTHRDGNENAPTERRLGDRSVNNLQHQTSRRRQNGDHPENDTHEERIKQRKAYLLRICRGLMEYGAPTHRLETYMKRTAEVLDIRVEAFYLPACMFISFSDLEYLPADMHIVRCTQSLNLSKLYQVHAVYRDIIHSRITIEEAIRSLDEIAGSKAPFSPPARVVAYGLASMCIGPVSYGARPIDLPMIFFLGSLLGLSELIFAPRSELFSQIFEILTTILIAFFARALGSIRLPADQGFCFSALCQASIVMILPGFIITNSALELQGKHIIAGSVRLVYGLVFILFLAFGITIGTAIYGALDSSATSLTTCTPPWPVWWQIIFVPLFTLAFIIVNQAPWRKMPPMILITLAGWAVTYFSGQYFYTNTIISQSLGALTIGILANLCSRLGHAFAAALLHPAIFILVPGSLAASGGLVSGIQSADTLNNRTGSNSGATSGNQAIQHFELLNAGYSMIEIAIGITVGLSVSTFLVYPFRKKTGKSGIFSF